MLSFRTNGFNGHSCKYSPFYDNKLAVATSANYGLVGNGKLFILTIQNNGMITADTSFDTQDGLFDVCWSEFHENHVLTCSGDGSISLFDIKLNQFPIRKWKEHQREVFSINWNLIDKSIFCSSSWDGTIKIWNHERPESLFTLTSPKDTTLKLDPINLPHSNRQQAQNPINNCIYQSIFSPHDPSILISVNSASHVQMWDMRSRDPLVCDFIGHRGLEILCVDYNKYRPTVIATGSVDKSIKIWDLRMIPPISANRGPIPNADKMGPTPINKLIGHEFAIKKVTWSPYESDRLISASYDMTVRVWKDMTDIKTSLVDSRRLRHGDALLGTFDKHREFAMGCDWSLWAKGYVASVGWDEMVYVWKA